MRRACATALFLASFTCAEAAPTLRSADIRIAIRSADVCDVTMTIHLDGGGAVDHRIEAAPDARIDLSAVRGARMVQEPGRVGRTQSLVLEPADAPYELSYSAQGFASHRCPLWVPVAPADGVSRAVRLSVALFPGARPYSTMPAFAWNGSSGTATLGHIPAFARVPYTVGGEAGVLDIATVMDGLTMLVFAAASGFWFWRRRRVS